MKAKPQLELSNITPNFNVSVENGDLLKYMTDKLENEPEYIKGITDLFCANCKKCTPVDGEDEKKPKEKKKPTKEQKQKRNEDKQRKLVCSTCDHCNNGVKVATEAKPKRVIPAEQLQKMREGRMRRQEAKKNSSSSCSKSEDEKNI